jgi:hypothetical protein
MDAYYFYQFEFPLNLLYATSGDPGEFHKHIILPDKQIVSFWIKYDTDILKTNSYWGEYVYDLRKLITIHYRGEELLVNREIAQKYPNAIWVDREFPELPRSVPEYPLRHKLKGFY